MNAINELVGEETKQGFRPMRNSTENNNHYCFYSLHLHKQPKILLNAKSSCCLCRTCQKALWKMQDSSRLENSRLQHNLWNEPNQTENIEYPTMDFFHFINPTTSLPWENGRLDRNYEQQSRKNPSCQSSSCNSKLEIFGISNCNGFSHFV